MEFDGSVTLVGNEWIVRGRPDVLFRAARSIMNATQEKNTVVIPSTSEAAMDILWFSQRFRLNIENPLEIRSGAAKFVRSQHLAQQVFTAGYVPQKVAFRKGKAPRHYQSIAADLFVSTGSLLLADEVGLGKTISTAAAIIRPALRPAVVVLPVHLTAQWAEKLDEFIPGLRIHDVKTGKLYDTPQFKECSVCKSWQELKVRNGRVAQYQMCSACGKPLGGTASGPDVYLISYHKLNAWADRLSKVCKTVIYDECQELRRNKTAKWEGAKRLSTSVRYRLGLSATPCHNLGGEMWNVMECIAPGRLGAKEVFQATWCEGHAVAGKEPALRDPAELGGYLKSQHLLLRRTRADVGRELPRHSKVVHTIEADPNTISQMEVRAADLAKIILAGSDVRGELMNAYGQFESILRQQTGLAKAPYVAAFVDMLLQEGTPLILFGWHRAVYEIWMAALEKYNPVLYTGTESKSQKNAAKRAFVTGDTDLFICSLRSGAGLDGLQDRCQTAVFGELDWSHAIHHQCAGRIHRDGQQKPSLSYYLVCDYLTDPIIARALQLKKSQSDGILGSVEPTHTVTDTKRHIRDIAAQFARRVG